MTHSVLRQRLMRLIEALPEEQVYQVLDYIEFLESKYGQESAPSASGLQKIAEGIEDRLRRRSVNPGTIREAFQVISAADRVLSGVSAAGKRVLNELGQVVDDRQRSGEDTRSREKDRSSSWDERSYQGGGRSAESTGGGRSTDSTGD